VGGLEEMKRDLADAILRAYTIAVIIFILLPLVVIIPTSFGTRQVVQFPPTQFTTQWYATLLTEPEWGHSAFVSVVVATGATLLSGIFGLMASYSLVRFQFRGRTLLIAFLISPLVFPTVMYGIAMLIFLGSLGFRGGLGGILLAHTILTVPFVVRTIGAGMMTTDVQHLEEAARSLGYGRVRTFVNVTVPSIRSAILAGALFAFIMSFVEFDATIFLVTPQTNTLPVTIFTHLVYVYNPVITAVSSILLGVAVLVIVGIERFFGFERYFRL
jgi:putative spermidine/putrescine transport system permease protein